MKLNEFSFEEKDIITTDRYLFFCRDNNFCYIKTDYFYIGQFNWRGNLHPELISNRCVVGHSDYPIVDTISNYFDLIICINKDTDNVNTYGIPLGVCNDTNESHLHPIFGNNSDIIDISKKQIDKKNLSYLNFNISNYPNDRQLVSDLFSNKNWVLNGNINQSSTGRRKYLEEIKSSKFVFCPRGNGIDTHRIWESLYMGSIPIVKYESAHHLFTDLPILFIKDWNEISEDFLNDKYLEITNKDWKLDKLKIGYWTDFIKNKIENE
jgi:hypothetical protein